MSVRVAVLGAGGHSTNNHGPSLRDYAERHPGGLERAAVCDLDEAKARTFSERFGFEAVYTDLERMLAEEALDGIAAITPIALTVPLAGRLLEAGIPVVVEKPPGVGVAGAEALLAVARRTGTPHMVSMNRRFNPALTRAVDWLRRQGRRPRHVASRMLRTKRLEADHARDTGIHAVDTVLSVIGPPARVEGRCQRVEGGGVPWFTGHAETAAGVTASWALTPDAGRVEETLEILGDGFRIHVDIGAAELRIDADGTADVERWAAADEGLADHEINGAYAETAAFVEALAGQTPMAPGLAEALVSVRAAVALQEGRTVTDLATDAG